MASAAALKCKQCGRVYEVGRLYMCDYCFGALEVDYDYARIARQISRKRFKRGPASLWRCRDVLPLDSENPVELFAGCTPMASADRLAKELGLKNLFIKNESANPTGSIKDRMVAVAVSKAVEFGYETVACASAGNLAHSLAAHAAKAGLHCVIFLPRDVDPSLVSAAGVYGAEIIVVKGDSTDVNRLCTEAASLSDWAFINVHLRPFYAEGAKTLSYEIAEAFDWSLPGNVILPMASGATMTAVTKGFIELRKLGLIRGAEPRLIGVQAEGCSPIVRAFDAGTSVILPVKPNTVAKSLAVGRPGDGVYALDCIRNSEGWAVAVSDDEIIECVSLLARTEGIYSDPSGGAAVAALRNLVQRKKVRTGEQVVLVIPARGPASHEQMEALSSAPREIEPTMEALKSHIAQLKAKPLRHTQTQAPADIPEEPVTFEPEESLRDAL